MTPRFLFIVARERPDRYEYLRRAFADDPEVEVIVDRRHGERRRRHAGGETVRQRWDHRRREDRRTSRVDNLLHRQGWAVADEVC